MFGFFMLAAIAFVGYAVYTQYKNTDATQSVPKRVWAAVVLAGAAIVAAISSTGSQ